MGSWCDLKIDGFSLGGSKSQVDDMTLSIFNERERRVRLDPEWVADSTDEEAEYIYEYTISAQAMRERLDALGFTGARARADYAANLAEEIASAREWQDAEEITR